MWLEGPPMNELRREHAAVVCNGGVYVVGGGNGKLRFDSIERIEVVDLLQGSHAKKITKRWTTLNCRLTTARNGCSAAAVHDR